MAQHKLASGPGNMRRVRFGISWCGRSARGFSNLEAANRQGDAESAMNQNTDCGKSPRPFCHSERSEESLLLFRG